MSPMSPRLLRPRASTGAPTFNPANLVLVYDTSKETANLQVSVPLNGTVNCTIDWGDGSSESHTTTGFKTHTYASAGIYTVQISGTMTTLNYGTGANTTNNKLKLVACRSFGNIGLTSAITGFFACTNLVECPPTLPSGITVLQGLFSVCTSFNDSRMVQWNTANVTNMNSLFQSCSAFNQPIGNWNVAEVTSMNSMFNGASAFSQPLAAWNLVKCTNTGTMFANMAYNQDISGWNMAAVTSMQQMFFNNSAFNQPIGSWNTSAVTNMNGVFQSTNAFNQDISGWDTSRVNTMQNMFLNAGAFSQDISNWDIRKVTTMASMFNTAVWGTANYDAALEDWADLADTDLTIGTTANTSQAITAFATLSAGTQTRVTSNGHGLVAGSRVNISGTTNYNGDYNVLAAAVNTFDIAVAFVANDATGTMKHRRSRNVTAAFGTNQYSSGAPTTARGVLTGTYSWSITDGGQV
jgi:surface protein